MTSDIDRTPTALRPRRTTASAAPADTTLALSGEAQAAVARICGGRPLEELVLLSSAVLLVVAAAESIAEPGVLVSGPQGPVHVRHDLSMFASVGELVRATDAALRDPAPPAPAGGAVLVRSAMIGRPAADDAVLDLALESGVDGHVLHLRDPAGHHDRWFLDVLLRAVEAVLADLSGGDRELRSVTTAAAADVAEATAAGAAHLDPEPVADTLLRPIRTVAERNPEWLAVVAGGNRLSYGELWSAAGQVAAHLLRLGVRRGDRVGVLTGKSAEALPAILGVLRAGAAYVPLDHRSPGGRLSGMVDDAGCLVVLTADGHGELLAGHSRTVALVDVRAALRAAGPVPELPAVEPTDLAYVMYTSGSTGAPKGVRVTHQAIAAYTRWKVAYDVLGPDCRVLQLPALVFDSSVSDIFPALAAGAALVLADAQTSLPRDLAGLMTSAGITHVTVVPSLYRLLLPHLGEGGLKLVTVAGEATDAGLVAQHHAMLPAVRLVNEYGPAENSVCATAFDHRPDAGPGFPIGRPIATSVVRVVNPAGSPVPAGFIGEILLTGHGLAEGYHDRPALTAAAFTTDGTGVRWYHTHDLAWWRPDGILEFAGRSDEQIKIRGQRIELGEIEAVLGAAGEVEAAAALTIEDASGTAVVAAFVQAPESAVTAVHDFAAERLAPAMVPAVLRAMPSLPLLPSGKPDRRALAAILEAERSVPATPAADGGDDVITAVAQIFQSVVDGAPFGPDDDFILRGGHSLTAISAIARIEERFGVFIDVADFLESATPREIAGLVRDAGVEQPPSVQPAAGEESLRRLLEERLDTHG